MNEINEKSRVTISLVIVIIGAAAWLTTVWAQGLENSSAIAEIKSMVYSELRRINDKLDYIMERLPRN